MIEVDEFCQKARVWLAEQLPPASATSLSGWGVGDDTVAVFNNLAPDEEVELLRKAADWQRRKVDAGFSALTAPVELGGAGLTQDHERAFNAEEINFETPATDELLQVTVDLVAPTLVRHGSDFLKAEYVRAFLRADLLCCQMFSEPGSGSDLASLSTSARRDGDDWVINGQKVWSSGARHAQMGLLLTRSDRDVALHKGLTAFLIPMDTPGVEVRPIRQITGGASFNEVFLTDVRLPDRYRLGDPGQGWAVAITTLQYERERSAMSGTFDTQVLFAKVLRLVVHLGVEQDPLVRQKVADLYARVQSLGLVSTRIQEALISGQPPGAEGSSGRLIWTQLLTAVSELLELVLGPAVVADTGEWGMWAWSQHLLGAPGYRIAGGTEEIQRNIIAERVLGMPREPRVEAIKR